MKVTLKNFIVSSVALVMLVVILLAVDTVNKVNTASAEEGAKIRVKVTDLTGSPLHNAEVCVPEIGLSFKTDNKGMSPLITIGNRANVYSPEITEWFCVKVIVKKDGFVDAIVINCVIYADKTRNLNVKLYGADQSGLPYVCYVESLPDEYIKGLLK